MESDRPHHVKTLSRNISTSSELFICFTSRLSSSSSMKISKSVLSPARSARDPPPHHISLSSSISRRLKTSGSLKGGQSPMFPASTKKKTAAGFENPEPSSPKVTCIGQVRVKSKKKKKKNAINNIRSRSQCRSGDYSFRRIDGDGGYKGLKRQSSTAYRNREIELESCQRHRHDNQKWVHIPITICESLRNFGADFSCFRSSSDRGQQHRGGEGEKGSGSSCGSVLARWLVAVEEGESGEKGRQIELVVGGDEDAQVCGRTSFRKRHVMEDIDIREIEKELKDRVGCLGRDEVVEGRVSICVPPKNALLLMRCGSDPVKMAALANRFWEPPVPDLEEEKDEHREDKVYKERQTELAATTTVVSESVEQASCVMVPEADELEMAQQVVKCEDEHLCDKYVTEEETYENVLEDEVGIDPEQTGNGFEDYDMQMPTASYLIDEAVDHQLPSEDYHDTDEQGQMSDHDRVDCEEPGVTESDDPESEAEEEEEEPVIDAGNKEASALPDCLLLMMCEPKLSMEVSEETWVCSTDFIRWLPPREVFKQTKNNEVDGLSKRVSIHWRPPAALPQKAADSPHLIPPRSSCSYPAQQEPTCDPLYLTRCKSEPQRTAAKLAAAVPEGCFWKDRKIEPHAPVGVGAAGAGAFLEIS
uniref:Uncharacterized protein n=1 Tax=Kalanchoe fedtschenkoi TaxID=63787 RepID=A0A7N0V8S9_KALFE